MTTDDLAGKVALITGSTSGIGSETAQLFAAQGAHVIVSGRNAERGAATVKRIEDAGGKARFLQADLTDLASIRQLAAAAGPVDILVNNAAHFAVGPALTQDEASYDESFAANVRAPYFLTAALAPAMVERGAGSIVNVSTMAAQIGMAGMSVYSATKAALESLTRTWAAELSGSGVRVNAVAPGPTRTDAMVATLGEETSQQVGGTTLLGRMADGREIAEAILFLASERASYITGATLPVDAGRTAV